MINDGCTASEGIWALVYDPIICCLLSLRPLADLRGFVCADELGLAARRVADFLRVLFPYFLLVLRAAGSGCIAGQLQTCVGDRRERAKSVRRAGALAISRFRTVPRCRGWSSALSAHLRWAAPAHIRLSGAA